MNLRSDTASGVAETNPDSFRNVHEGMILELNRQLQSGLTRQQDRPNGAAVLDDVADISPYVLRIQRAGTLIASSAARIRELEDALYDLKQQSAELLVSLDKATGRTAELEQQLDAERQRAEGAEARALHAEARTEELQTALARANDTLTALMASIQNAFGTVPEAALAANEVA